MKQSDEILKNGYVTSGGGRGKMANAHGNAYANGTYSGGGRFWGGASIYNGYGNGNNSNGSTGSISDAAKEETKEVIDWVEIMIDRIERLIDDLDTKATSVYRSWSDRNNNLAKEIENVRKEIDLQKSAYNTYLAKADSIDLAEEYKQKVRDGRLEIEDITDENLKDLIDEYQTWYEKSLECYYVQTDLEEKVSELIQLDFDNIVKQYEQIIDAIERTTDAYSTQLDIIENRGNFAGAEYYDNIMKNQKKQMSTIEKQIETLQKNRWANIWNGNTKLGSEQDKENLAKIEELQNEYRKIYNDSLQTKNDKWKMDWSVFDKTIEYISRITEETQFLVDVLSMNGNDLFDNITGKLSKMGNSVGALHAVNYGTYMDEADMYAKKITEINKLIKKDPTNTILIDQRNSYLKAQYDSIEAANKEKEAVKDLYEDSYKKMLDVLKDMIDKKKKQLNSEKDIYNYQKNVKKQTKEITDLQKQLLALENDDSEEALSKVQKLKDELNEAKENLEETEYDKWLNDQEDMLDNLYQEYEDILNQRLDNIDYLMQQMIDYANANASTIKNTIKQAAASVGYSITGDLNGALTSLMTDMYDKNAKFGSANEQNNSVNKYVNSVINSTSGSVDSSGNYVQVGLNEDKYKSDWEAELARRKAEEEAKAKAKAKAEAEAKKKAQTTASSQANTHVLDDATIKGIASAIWCEAGSGWGSWPDRENRLNEKFGAGAYEKVQNYINGHINDLYSYWINNLGGNAKKFWYSSFDTGGYTGNEEGFAMLHKKERILNPRQTVAWEDFVYKFLPNLTEISDNMANGFAGMNNDRNVNANVSVSFNLPNVTDTNSFIKELQSNKKFTQLVQSMTIDQVVGKSSLSKNKIRF